MRKIIIEPKPNCNGWKVRRPFPPRFMEGRAPRGLFDDDLADKIVELIASEERIEQGPFHRYADFSRLTHIRLKIGHVFDVAKRRRAVTEAVKSAFFADTIVGFGIARMYESLMEGATIQARAFRERAAAAEWLSVPLEILQPDAR